MGASRVKIVAMQYVALDGREVPKLGLGTWQLTGDACEHAVRDALELGYRHIDTAQGYENEAEVGAALSDSAIARERVFITSKTWADQRSAQDIRNGLEESLRRLRSDYVDLFLVHWPPRETPLELALETMFELQKAGKIRHVGVSNFTNAQLDAAQRVGPIACNQVELHPYLSQHALVHRAQREGLIVTAYSPLAQGKISKDPLLQKIGERHGKTPAQVTLRWLVSKPQVCAIPKAASEAHRRSNLEIFDFALSDEELSQIDALDRGERLLDPPWAPAWDA